MLSTAAATALLCLSEENAVRQKQNYICTQNVNEDNQYNCNFVDQGRDSELMRSYTHSRETLIRMPVRLTSRKLMKHLRNREPSRVYINRILKTFLRRNLRQKGKKILRNSVS